MIVFSEEELKAKVFDYISAMDNDDEKLVKANAILDFVNCIIAEGTEDKTK